MKKLKLPKKPYTGMKVYCNICKKDNAGCSHYDEQNYRIRIHVPNTKNRVKVKIFDTDDYNDAVVQAIEFKKQLNATNYTRIKVTTDGNDYSLAGALLKYKNYLEGNHELEQNKKSVSKGHINESLRFCKFFAGVISERINIHNIRVMDIDKYDVSDFYKALKKKKYEGKTFNKCLAALKRFFKYLIDVEEIDMKNPFAEYESKSVAKKNIISISKEEFLSIINAVDTASPYQQLGGKGEVKNMYKDYLKIGFWLCLYTGGRREEVVNLKWNDMVMTISGNLSFEVHNLKVNRRNNNDDAKKYFPIYPDFANLLYELGYPDKINRNGYILHPERVESAQTIMDALSKAFTHYRIAAGIKRDISLSTLRKTFISWLNEAVGVETGLLTSHTTEDVLKNHYIDSQIASAINKATHNVRIFGEDDLHKPHSASSL
jgi:integrase